MKKVGVVDIAREAGVSITTVSRVVNDSPLVAEKTRKRVLGVIERMEFLPNALASDLRRGRSRTIGLAVASISQPWHVKLTRAIRHAVSEHEYTTIIYDLEHKDRVLIEHAESARALQLAGMILATGDRIDAPDVRAALGKLSSVVPLVVIGQKLEGVDWPTLRFDDVAAAEEATRELLRRRPRPMVFLGQSPRSFLAAERMEGVRRALTEFPGERDASLFLTLDGDMDYMEGYALIRGLGPEIRRFGSLICVNDELALGASRAALEAGVAVPQDLMILGYGDTDMLPYVYPSVSSVSGDVQEVAEDAIEAIISRINGEHVEPEKVYQRRFVHRESTSSESDFSRGCLPLVMDRALANIEAEVQ